MQLSDRQELALALVATAPVLAFDLETTGLEIDAKVVGYAVAHGDRAVYVPVRHESGNVNNPRRFEAALAAAFQGRTRQGLRTVGFNLAFDLFHAGHYGVWPGAPLEDAQINEVLVYEYHRAYDLQACLERRGFPGKDDERLLHELARRFGGAKTRRVQMRNFWRLPGDGRLAWDYACSDVRGTYALWAVQQHEITAPDSQGHTLARVHRLECDLIPHLARMRCRGIRVDQAYAEDAVARLDERIDKSLQNFPQGFSAGSTDQLHAWMTGQGAASQYKTNTGKPSYTSKTLEGSTAGRQVTELRQLLKTKSTFLAPMLGRDRIHPELKQMADGEYGVKFGRFSCIGPNLQAFPKRNKAIGQIVRPVIVPDKGMMLQEADYSQQEPRLYAHFAKCERLLKGYNSKPVIDVHTLASQLMGIGRDQAKTLGLSIFNGMTPKTLAGRLNVDEVEAKRLYNSFFRAFPEIAQFKDDAASVAGQRGYVRTILGRRQHFPENLSTHVAVSRVIQGSAGDHMKVRLLEACQWVEACGAGLIDILMSIHDSIIWQSEMGHGTTELRAILEDPGDPLWLSTPMPIEIHCGRNWGEVSYPDMYMREAA